MLSSSGYGLGAAFVRVFMAPFVHRRVLGRSNVPATGPCILAPNHISHFDPPLIGISTGRPVDWMAMEELFRNPVLAALLRWVGSFPVGRGKMDYAAVRTAIARLERGRMVGVFPEGGLRTGAESVLEGAPLKPGVAALAQMTQAPVLPCAVIGSDALYAPSCWLPLRRASVWVIFGEPLPPPAREGDKAAARTAFEALLGGKIRGLYERTVREAGIPPECLPQTPQRRKGRA
ncbi:MAG: 1-acyl-sn-glycerol-3-phosphate acyltransferase [Chthoniobacterales bacterium]|nr:1-acyl-sn-glycerol-3-phosphate acyltransferase [Chthoniobacterales bacterium]